MIGIIALLAAMLFPVMKKARRKGLVTHCENNLRQLSYALLMFREENNDHNVSWLSRLYPDYINGTESLICIADPSDGADGSKPDADVAEGDTVADTQYDETNDGTNNLHGTSYRDRNTQADVCSYLYEFCNAECSWGWQWYLGNGSLSPSELDAVDRDGDGTTTWEEVKWYQMRFGDTSNGGQPYLTHKFPIVRCFHHFFDDHFTVPDTLPGTYKGEGLTLNVSYDGNVFRAPYTWEYAK